MIRPAAVLLLVALAPAAALAHGSPVTGHATTLSRQYAHPPADGSIKAHAAPKHTHKFPWWFLRRHIAATN